MAAGSGGIGLGEQNLICTFVIFNYYCRGLISRGEWERRAPGLGLCLHPNLTFGNSFGTSYTKLVILDIKFRFTCGESDPY